MERNRISYALVVLCLLISQTAMAGVLIHDPLVGSTVGTQIGGGTFIGISTPGWKSTGGKIVYDAGRMISNGYFEAKMRGWTAPAGGIDKSHPLAGWESKNRYSHHSEPGAFWNWRIGYHYNPFKVLASPQGLGLREEARVGSNAAVNAGAPAAWHTYRVEWNKGVVKFIFNGTVIKTFSFSRFQNRYFTIGKDDQYGIASPSPIISDVTIFDASYTPPPIFSFDLCGGMNLISNVYQSAGITDADGLLNSICPGNASSIWRYNCTSGSFRSWTNLDIGEAWGVWPGTPFWVNITNPAGCTWDPPGKLVKGFKYSLCPGLNIVAIPLYTTSLQKASHLLNAIPGCNAVYRWRREANCANAAAFDAYFNISSSADDFTLNKGYAYYINVIGTTSWTPPDP